MAVQTKFNNMKTIKLEDCTIEIIAEQESSSIEQVLSFKETGADHSNYINKVLKDDGYNTWLWCSVEVKLSYKNILFASEYLGCCAYENEQEFKDGGYYEDMLNACLKELNEQLSCILN